MTPYYSDDACTLYHADCMETLPLMEAKSVDCVLTDPPYEAEAHTKARRVKGVKNGVRWGGRDPRLAEVSALPFEPMSAKDRDATGADMARLAKRWVLVFCQVEAAMDWRAALEQNGEHVYRRTCVWIKPDGQPQFTGDRPGMGYESIVATHAAGRCAWNGGGKLGVFEAKPDEAQIPCVFRFIKNVTGSKTHEPHPTTKPLALIRELVQLFTDPGELILDCFAGSGTTGLAARMEGRRAILIEREERYCEVAARRLEHYPREHKGQLALLGRE